MKTFIPEILTRGDNMARKYKTAKSDCLRLNPEARLCPKFDASGILAFPFEGREDMGVCVIDDCAEEHIM
ncbi:hypothetical protein SDC9_68934 [bioreactor metagenome]|uniref:Uncharacterized protein n=1 Tax=bioreactor metagenome TaxID=1076179 RepID=A0A644Y2A0_9ZZZZ